MKKPLFIFLLIVGILSAVLIAAMKMLGQSGNYLAALYMLGPAIAALITRAFFYEKKFSDANLRFGRVKDYLKYWAIALLVSSASLAVFSALGSITFDFSGQIFLGQLGEQMAMTGQDINDLPAGFTPQMMLVLFFIGGLTIFNIIPGLITGFGEEFGWRGLMFPLMYRIKPWMAFIVGGLIWYAWHLPLALVLPQVTDFTLAQEILNFSALGIASVCTFAFLAYIYIKTENIFVVSLVHITLNNSARSFSYFVEVQDQVLANVGLMITMILVVAILYYLNEFQIFQRYFTSRSG